MRIGLTSAVFRELRTTPDCRDKFVMARSSEEMKGKTDFRKLVGRVSRLQVVEFSLLTVSDKASRVTWENSEKMVVLPPDGGSRSKREVVGGGILALMS